MEGTYKKHRTQDSFDEIYQELFQVVKDVEKELTKIEKLISNLQKDSFENIAEKVWGKQNLLDVPLTNQEFTFGSKEKEDSLSPDLDEIEKTWGKQTILNLSLSSEEVIFGCNQESTSKNSDEIEKTLRKQNLLVPLTNQEFTFGSKEEKAKCVHCKEINFNITLIRCSLSFGHNFESVWKCCYCKIKNKLSYTEDKAIPVFGPRICHYCNADVCNRFVLKCYYCCDAANINLSESNENKTYFSGLPVVKNRFIYVTDYVLYRGRKHVWVSRHPCKTSSTGYRDGHYRRIEK